MITKADRLAKLQAAIADKVAKHNATTPAPSKPAKAAKKAAPVDKEA